ncbi:hypothetical protein Ddye_005930, partial [Dipteronia dyeriana]
NMIGEVLEIDAGPSRECVGKFIRVLIVNSVKQPLRKILWVDVLQDGKDTIMLLRYDRLSEHCFRYGRLGHVAKNCVMESQVKGVRILASNDPIEVGRKEITARKYLGERLDKKFLNQDAEEVGAGIQEGSNR